jgi:hypothetical protein
MFNFFKRSTVKVTLIEYLDNKIIDEIHLGISQLPQSFKEPTTMHINNNDWQVIKAEPEDYSDIYKSGELKLWLRPVVTIDSSKLRYTIPTISNELPDLIDVPEYNDFTIELYEDDWRQIEFLPAGLLPAIQEEMADVEAILFPDDESEPDLINGFDTIHVRRRIGRHQLDIPLEEFCEQAGIIQRGNIVFHGQAEFVKNGIALKSKNYIWYGIAESNRIKELALQFFESIDSEIMHILHKYDLLMIEWCRGSITGA